MNTATRPDPASAPVTLADGRVADLRPQAAALLAFLADRAGQVVSKDALMDAVWPDTSVTENSLYQCVTEIRRALGADGDKILQTVPRKGYRLVLPEPDTPDTPRFRRWPLAALAAGVVLLAALLAWALAPRPAAVAAAAPSIVILPFEATEGDERWTRIGRGLSAEIAGVLARNDWLDVIAPHSAQTLAGQDASAAVDSFGVRYVMTGGLQVAGDTLRINASLHDAETDRLLWSERWQRPQAEIFDVQDEILARIESSLGPVYTGVLARSGLDRAHQSATYNLSAFESFLLGIEQKHKFTPEGMEAAVPHLERAVALDPGFATGWASLSLLHIHRTYARPAEEHAAIAALASDAIERGLAADPTDPHVNWRMAGHVSKVLGDRTGARTYLRRAAELAPSDADVLMIVAWMSPNIGIYGPEPLAQAEHALRLNPRAPAWYKTGHGLAAFAAGEYRLSADLFESAPSAADTLFFKALAHFKLSEMAEAQRARDALMTAFPNFVVQNYMGVVPPGDPSYEAVILPAKALNIPLTPPEPVVSVPPSIVILPFEAPEDDPRWTRIGRGLSAEIAGVLARNDWLDVIAPHSAQTLAGQDASAAVDSFGVRYVMTGGLLVAGDTLRINASLHDAETDRVLWSERWQRPQAEIFDVQDEILARIESSLGSTFSFGVLARSGLDRAHQRVTDDMSAFESFLLGLEQKQRFTPEGFEAALPHLERAVALDPDFATAWAALSLVHTYRKWTRPAEELATVSALAAEAIARGLAADPSDPHVNWRMAGYSARDVGDRTGARTYLRRAVDLAPGDADVLMIFGWTSPIVGIQGPEPLAFAEHALRLNPRAPAWYKTGHGLAAFASGEYRLSADLLGSAPSAADTLFFKALAHHHLSEMAEAQRTRDALMTAYPSFVVQNYMGVVLPGDPSFEAVILPARALNIPMTPPEPVVSAAR